MAFSKLAAHEKKVAEAKRAEAERIATLDLKRAVKAVIPKNALVPKRGRGRTAAGGLSRKEVAELRRRAAAYLDGEAGMEALATEVQRQAVVILLIDGIMGTEPWRAAGGPHAGLIAANARLRYLDNAGRLLDDLRRSRGQSSDPQKRLMEGVIDAEVVK